MFHLAIFGGYEGPLAAGSVLHITLFAGTEVKRWPLARYLIERRRGGHATSPLRFFLTLFGGTEMHWPTLTEEFLALREAIRGGELTLADFDRALAQPDGQNNMRAYSLSLFGAFEGNKLPSEERELDELSLQRHLGHIPDPAVQTLTLGINQMGVGRLSIVRQAVAGALNA